jgi:hypothetical protein
MYWFDLCDWAVSLHLLRFDLGDFHFDSRSLIIFLNQTRIITKEYPGQSPKLLVSPLFKPPTLMGTNTLS